jgi:hypothetical protein
MHGTEMYFEIIGEITNVCNYSANTKIEQKNHRGTERTKKHRDDYSKIHK